MVDAPEPAGKTKVPYLEPTKEMQAAYLELAMAQIARIRTSRGAEWWKEKHEQGYKRDLTMTQYRQVEDRLKHAMARLVQRRGR